MPSLRHNAKQWFAVIATIAVTVFGPSLAPPASAQLLPLEDLVARADAIILAEVNFVPYGDMVLLSEIFRGDQTTLPNLNGLLGPCLPGRAALHKLVEQTAAAKAQGRIYSEAFELATYRAVVFLAGDAGYMKPVCGTGVHSTENWESDPHYPLWRRRLDAALQENH